MAVLPIENGASGMTKRNYLVELNRLRVKANEEARKEYEKQELEEAARRARDRQEKQNAWKATSIASTAGQARPMPGGGPRSERMKATIGQRAPNYYKLEKERQARRKAEMQAISNADMQQQLLDHKEVVQKQRNAEMEQTTALRRMDEEENRRALERERQEAAELKAYHERLRKFNARELEQKRADAQAEEDRKLALARMVETNDRHRAEVDARRASDMKKSMQKQNEDYHRETMQRNKEEKKRHNNEIAEIMERNRRLAEKERLDALNKKERFRREFEDCIEREAEFRRTHNYDESEEVIRARNEQAAQSLKLIREEEKRRHKEFQDSYKGDLLKQMTEKYEYTRTHLDGL